MSVRLSVSHIKSMVMFTFLGICSFTCSLLWCFHLLLQELSKIAMPVVFNEPLSFLQRISEYMEHTHLIHKACSLSDSIDRMQVDIKGSDIMYLSVCHVFLFVSSLWAINEPCHTAPKYSVADCIRKKENQTGSDSFHFPLTVCCCICCFGGCISMGKDWKAI